MQKSVLNRCKKASLLCFFIFLVCAIVNIVLGIISVVNTPGTSFPWYSPIVLVGTYYIVPLAIFLLIYCILKKKEEKAKE